jgi:hypothetical protein
VEGVDDMDIYIYIYISVVEAHLVWGKVPRVVGPGVLPAFPVSAGVCFNSARVSRGWAGGARQLARQATGDR